MNDSLRATIERIKNNLDFGSENIEKYLYSQRLSSLGHLVCDIAHKFNNILGGILGYSQLLLNDLEPNSNAHRQVLVIEKATQRAAKLISMLHILASDHVYEKKLICPEKVVKEVAAILENTFNKNIQIEVRLYHDNEKIRVDFLSICHALLNVCLNARDAMSNGGKLIIETKLTFEKNKAQEIKKKDSSRKYVVFKISDTGVGIEEENFPFIFEPFFTTREYGQGSGLGLTIVEGIVKEHQGKIKVHSQKGKGTTFEICLPAVSKVPRGRKKPPEVENELGQGELILLVDDEEDLREMAKTIFEKKGYRVLLAKDGQSAIHTYTQYKNDIKLIILDMVLPDLDSEQICQQIKSQGAKPKIIVTSGYTDGSTINNIFKHGADSFVPKPWHLPELLKETRRVIHED